MAGVRSHANTAMHQNAEELETLRSQEPLDATLRGIARNNVNAMSNLFRVVALLVKKQTFSFSIENNRIEN